MDETIYFYSLKGPYGAFSNFSAHPIDLDGHVWPTSEHYFQAMKFLDPAIQAQVRRRSSPGRAALMGRRRDLPLRADWEEVKEAIMLAALRAKFAQHEDCRALLLGTGKALLVEHTARDRYWADGGDGSGKNRLGILLMQVRGEIRGGAGE